MIKVFYNPLQSAQKNESFSPSATKPALVAEAFRKLRGVSIDGNFSPATPELLSQAHEPDYVKSILACKKTNGFWNRLPEVAASLPWTSGSMLAAALYAIKNETAACSLTSGFHHAGYNYGHGFCTFNGLMVTAVELLRRGYKKIGILDLDAHLGDGTHDIISKLNLQSKVIHYTFGAEFSAFKTEQEWLDSLTQVIVDKFSQVDVLLYQAGADPHEEDPLGGYLSTKTMQERDAIVFSTCEGLRIPVAWNLAGGYQKPIEKVIELHVNTMKECLRAFLKEEEIKTPPLRGVAPILRKTYAIRNWAKWDKTIYESAEDFKKKSGFYPNILLASPTTQQQIDMAANNPKGKAPSGKIQGPEGEPAEGFASISGFVAGDLNLEFCIKEELPKGVFILVYDSDPDGGLPLPEEDNLGEEGFGAVNKRSTS